MNRVTESKFSDAGIQDISTSISITFKFEEMLNEDEDDESDNYLEAGDRRHSCLKTRIDETYLRCHSRHVLCKIIPLICLMPICIFDMFYHKSM